MQRGVNILDRPWPGSNQQCQGMGVLWLIRLLSDYSKREHKVHEVLHLAKELHDKHICNIVMMMMMMINVIQLAGTVTQKLI